MANKRTQHPFLENFRCYEVPRDKLYFVQRSIEQPQDLSYLQSRSSSPEVSNPAGKFNKAHTPPVKENAPQAATDFQNTAAPMGSDHFERLGMDEAGLSSSTNALIQKEIGGSESASNLFTTTQSLLYASPKEVRGLLSNLERALSGSQSFAKPPSSAFHDSSTLKSENLIPSSPLTTDVQTESVLAGHPAQEWSVHSVSENFVKGSLKALGLSSENPGLFSNTGSQTLLSAAQRLFQSIASRLPFSLPSQESFLSKSLLPHSEGAHLLQWGMHLGLTPRTLQVILPFLSQTQDMPGQSKSLFQGLAFLLGAFTGLLQQNSSNLGWMILKGMMILETQAQLTQAHSPLLDELGALLSTSRRRQRKKERKKNYSLDKVSRKDSCLADMDAQETAQDSEALIDLWPKKESNEPAMSFYYM